jgi:uncharacterized protein (TIGR02147 family)
MKTNTRMPDPMILKYVDYRDFLTDYVEAGRKRDRSFTHRSFAESAGVSVGLLSDILAGRQNLTPETMHKYARAMDLSKRDIDYFEAMVRFNNTTDKAEKNRWFDRMARFRGRSKVTWLTAAQYEYFSHWYTPVLREFVDGKPATLAPKEIAAAITPRIRVPAIKNALVLMKELGLIQVDEHGCWRKTDPVLSSELEQKSMALRKYHLQMIERASEALDRAPAKRREYQALTLSGGPNVIAIIKAKIRAFTDELLAIAEAEPEVQEVIQVNINMFPFTGEATKDEGGSDET